MKKTFYLVLTILFSVTLFSANVFSMEKFDYQVLIEPQYEYARNFSEGLAAVRNEGKFGYIDMNGKVVIPFKYDIAHNFSEGKALVGNIIENVEKTPRSMADYIMDYGIIDKNGHYTSINFRHNIGLMVSKNKEGNYKYEINIGKDPSTGQYFASDNFHLYSGTLDEVIEYNSPRAKVSELEEGLEYFPYELTDFSIIVKYIDGTFITKPVFYNGYLRLEYTNPLSYNGFYIVDHQGNRMVDKFKQPEKFRKLMEDFYINNDYVRESYEKGDVQLDMEIDAAAHLSVFPWMDGALTVNGLETGLYIKEDTKLIHPEKVYARVLPFNQGLAFVMEKGEEGYSVIDKQGNIIAKGPFTNVIVNHIEKERKAFNDAGLAVVRNMDGKWGAINKKGERVIAFEYSYLYPFVEGVAPFSKNNGKKGYIDVEGNEVIPAKFDQATFFNEGLAVVSIGEEAFIINKKGERIKGSENIEKNLYFISDNYQDAPSKVNVIRGENNKYGFSQITYTPDFPSEEEMSTWSYEEVKKAIEKNLVPVNLQNMYRTDATRIDFAALVVATIEKASGKTIDQILKDKTGKDIYQIMNEQKFNDTNDKNVVASKVLGIINGIGNNNFGPENHITREQAATLLQRTAEYLGLKTNASGKKFADQKMIADYAKASVDFVSNLNIMSGTENNNFSPKASYTREQAYITIYRLLENLNK